MAINRLASSFLHLEAAEGRLDGKVSNKHRDAAAASQGRCEAATGQKYNAEKWQRRYSLMESSACESPEEPLSVYIMDINKRVLHKAFDKNDQLKNVPWHRNLGDVLAYVTNEYFSPSLGELTPFQYPGKFGHGKPNQMDPDTTMMEVRRLQLRRHVPRKRLTVMGHAQFSRDEIKERYIARKFEKAAAGMEMDDEMDASEDEQRDEEGVQDSENDVLEDQEQHEEYEEYDEQDGNEDHDEYDENDGHAKDDIDGNGGDAPLVSWDTLLEDQSMDGTFVVDAAVAGCSGTAAKVSPVAAALVGDAKFRQAADATVLEIAGTTTENSCKTKEIGNVSNETLECVQSVKQEVGELRREIGLLRQELANYHAKSPSPPASPYRRLSRILSWGDTSRSSTLPDINASIGHTNAVTISEESSNVKQEATSSSGSSAGPYQEPLKPRVTAKVRHFDVFNNHTPPRDGGEMKTQSQPVASKTPKKGWPIKNSGGGKKKVDNVARVVPKLKNMMVPAVAKREEACNTTPKRKQGKREKRMRVDKNARDAKEDGHSAEGIPKRRKTAGKPPKRFITEN